MPLLSLIRKNRLACARSMLSTFISMWLLFALQPCAMAFNPADSTDNTDSEASHCMQFLAAPSGPGEVPPDSASSNSVPPDSCPHCDNIADPSLCLADDWSESKQLTPPGADPTPAVAERLILLLALFEYSPPHPWRSFPDSDTPLSQPDTPTALHDISRC